jgi:hypothetical protein
LDRWPSLSTNHKHTRGKAIEVVQSDQIKVFRQDGDKAAVARIEKTEELQLHHKHEKFLFFGCAVALCAIQNGLLVISILT